MNDIRKALVQFICGDAAVSAVVGARVYPLKIPQGVNQPSIVYTRISGLSGHHMTGRDGLARTRIQIDCWSLSADISADLADKLKDRLDGFSGVMGSGPLAVEVQGVFFADERELFDDEVKMYNVSRDYLVHFDEL